jgi:hypothetical protein
MSLSYSFISPNKTLLCLPIYTPFDKILQSFSISRDIFPANHTLDRSNIWDFPFVPVTVDVKRHRIVWIYTACVSLSLKTQSLRHILALRRVRVRQYEIGILLDLGFGKLEYLVISYRMYKYIIALEKIVEQGVESLG